MMKQAPTNPPYLEGGDDGAKGSENVSAEPRGTEGEKTYFSK
jgi:hypothetical protein